MTTHSIVPILRVTELRAAEVLYCSVLGFRKEWERAASEAGPHYIGLVRDGNALYLSSFEGDGAGVAVYLNVENVDRLYAEFRRAGLERAELEPTDQSWGQRELHIRDPDGNSLRFGAPIAKPIPELKYTLSLVRIFVSDLPRALDFYTRTLGMRSTRVDEAKGLVELATGAAELALERADPSDPESARVLGRFLGLSLSVPDIHACYWTLVSRGVDFVDPPEKQAWGGTLAHFKDLDSNVLTLIESPRRA